MDCGQDHSFFPRQSKGLREKYEANQASILILAAVVMKASGLKSCGVEYARLKSKIAFIYVNLT